MRITLDDRSSYFLCHLVTLNPSMWPFPLFPLLFGHIEPFNMTVPLISFTVWSHWTLQCDRFPYSLCCLVTLSTSMWPFILVPLLFGNIEPFNMTVPLISFTVWSHWPLQCDRFPYSLCCLVTLSPSSWPFHPDFPQFGHLDPLSAISNNHLSSISKHTSHSPSSNRTLELDAKDEYIYPLSFPRQQRKDTPEGAFLAN